MHIAHIAYMIFNFIFHKIVVDPFIMAATTRLAKLSDD